MDGGEDGEGGKGSVVGYDSSAEVVSKDGIGRVMEDGLLSSIAACAALRNWSASMPGVVDMGLGSQLICEQR